MPRKDALRFDALRRRLETRHGRDYWRSLEELADTDEFQDYLQREFPEQAAGWNQHTTRRNFLKLMGASLALAGLGGCRPARHEAIVPYVQTPEHIVPGQPLFFATAVELHGWGTGLLVESHEGRPTKIEGNPDHPGSLGATDPFTQAEVLTLYDPDRSRVIRQRARISNWRLFQQDLQSRLVRHREFRGAGLRILTETVTSPTLIDQLQQLREDLPDARWHQYDPVFSDAAREGAQLAFGENGQDVQTIYNFEKADVVLSLDADFLAVGGYPIPYARGFMRRRTERRSGREPEMNRLYVAETTRTLAGAKADHRWAMRSDEILALAYTIAQRLGVDVQTPQGLADPPVPSEWIDALVDDLQDYRLSSDPGASLVIAGENQPPIVHALAHAMNDALGNVGTTVLYREPAVDNLSGPLESLRQLVADIRDGQVETLIILGGNPAFTAPADLEFAEVLSQVGFRVHLSLYDDETSRLCHWHLPQTHSLETWSDVRAYDGTAAIVQPLIAPLYEPCVSAHQVLALIQGDANALPYEIVRNYWRQARQEEDFETFWHRALHTGVIENTQAQEREPSLRQDFGDALAERSEQAEAAGEGPGRRNPEQLEIVFRPDPTIWDGRYANNGWLQELPKPFTKLTWDNAACVSPALAARWNLTPEDIVEIQAAGRTLRLPVWILPGLPDRSVTLHFGYGRTRAGRIGTETGFNVYSLRTADAPWFASAGELRKVEGLYPLATTQHHHLLNGRHLLMSGNLDDLRRDPEHPPFMIHHHEGPSFYPEWDYSNQYKWGMAVDQTKCIGCNACVVACQAENNIPIVGKDEVRTGREMHWLRIDTYYRGDEDDPQTYFQPMMCVHCEKAPCEVVCPVVATSHSSEGLNEMTYNRCVGTRYCSNNCPYKVRRFNFLEYTARLRESPSLQLQQNPNVSVRPGGVMEKCTYCVQRINTARITAENDRRRIEAGEVVTACAQACPTDAIVFGDLNNPQENVTQLVQEPIGYGVLEELNTQPRTTHLAALHNPNPQIQPAESHDGAS
jgi:MoCo/4Fe-4S cofactor protein with predicted Tat translocation signal